MNVESEEAGSGHEPGGQDNKGGAGESPRRRDNRTHDPIIVDSGSFDFAFDGGNEDHYGSLPVGSVARFFGPGLHVTRVEVVNKSDCPVPVGTPFVVEIEGELNGHRDVTLTVSSVLDVVEVSFKRGLFGNPSVSSHRKSCHHPDLKVTKVTVKDIFKTVLHTCTDIFHNGESHIIIHDDHVA